MENKKIGSKLFSIRRKLRWLDPFTYVDLFVMPRVKKITDSRAVEAIVNIVFAAIFAALIYVALGFLFGSSTPIVIVYSASMEDSFYRGDLMGLKRASGENVFAQEIFLERNLSETPMADYATVEYEGTLAKSILFENGEKISISEEGSVIVYPSYPGELPIIHRAVAKIYTEDGTFFLTKGDNNPVVDQDCGRIRAGVSPERECITFYAVNLEDIQGVSFFQIPKVGCIKLWLVDNLFSLIATAQLPKDFRGYC